MVPYDINLLGEVAKPMDEAADYSHDSCSTVTVATSSSTNVINIPIYFTAPCSIEIT